MEARGGGGAGAGAMRGREVPAEASKLRVIFVDKVGDFDDLPSTKGAKGRSGGGLSSSTRGGGVRVADFVVDGEERVVEHSTKGDDGARGEAVGVKSPQMKKLVAVDGIVVKVSPGRTGDAAPEDVAELILVVPTQVTGGGSFPRACGGSQSAVADHD